MAFGFVILLKAVDFEKQSDESCGRNDATRGF
jgi:hypothetical protein